MLSFLVTLPLLGQLPPGVSRVNFREYFYALHLLATPDDTMWVAPWINREMARVDVHGVQKQFNLPSPWQPSAFGVGPDGAVWAGVRGIVARIDPVTNAFTPHALGADPLPAQILAGPDGHLWIVDHKGRVLRMRTDGTILDMWEAGGAYPNGAAFGSDGALYVSTATQIVRITAAGEKSASPATTYWFAHAGRDFFWHATRYIDEPEKTPPARTITKTSFTGETLAVYSIAMAPMASDVFGNLWLRTTTEEGDIVGQLTPSGVLTRFGPLPALGSSDCHPRWYGGMTFLSGGRVAMSDYYPNIPVSLPSPPPPCYRVPKPADFKNTITIFDPQLLPVLSVESLNRTPRRRSARQ